MMSFSSPGNFSITRKFIARVLSGQQYASLNKWGRVGCEALATATPRDTGKTAESWRYIVIKERSGVKIQWYNTNMNEGEVIALLIQFSHGTGTGGYIQGRDFINPAIQPIFDKIQEAVWKEVTR